MRGWGLELLLIGALAAPIHAAPGDSLADAMDVARKTETVFEQLARRVQPAVVNIRRFTRDQAWWDAHHTWNQATAGWRVISQDDLLYPGMRPTGGASGFLVSDSGYVLTLRRVVVDPVTQKAADVIDVEIETAHYPATVVSLEPTLDLAILRVTPKGPVPFLKLGDSRKVRAGHWAIAFGDPDGRERTMVPGVVAYEPSRECYQDEMSATYLQTSMKVCDGALGGPLVDLQGEVIGINVRRGDPAKRDSLTAEAGSGYALPSNLVSYIFQSLVTRGSKVSPWLGISVRPLTEDLRKRMDGSTLVGIYIDNVFNPSPATAAGVKVGDVLQRMDGQPIANVYDFQRILYLLGSGSRVKLGIMRGKTPLELSAVITTRPPEATTR